MSIFDFNRDGEVSSSEQAFGLGAILRAFWRNSKSNAKIWKMRSRTILAAMPTMSGRSDVKISMKRSRNSKNCWMTDGGNL